MSGFAGRSVSAPRPGSARLQAPARCADRATALSPTGPFAETKEQFLGLYVVNCADRDAAVGIARDVHRSNPTAVYEIRPVMLYLPGVPRAEGGQE